MQRPDDHRHRRGRRIKQPHRPAHRHLPPQLLEDLTRPGVRRRGGPGRQPATRHDARHRAEDQHHRNHRPQPQQQTRRVHCRSAGQAFGRSVRPAAGPTGITGDIAIGWHLDGRRLPRRAGVERSARPGVGNRINRRRWEAVGGAALPGPLEHAVRRQARQHDRQQRRASETVPQFRSIRLDQPQQDSQQPRERRGLPQRMQQRLADPHRWLAAQKFHHAPDHDLPFRFGCFFWLAASAWSMSWRIRASSSGSTGRSLSSRCCTTSAGRPAKTR